MYDVKIPCLPKTFDFAPKRGPFIDKVIPRLQILYSPESEQSNEVCATNSESTLMNGFTAVSQERKDAANLLKTICKWIVGNVPRVAYSAPPELFKFLPIVRLFY
jgi:hypothetical protein